MHLGQPDAVLYTTKFASAWRTGAICLLFFIVATTFAMILFAFPPRSNHIAYDVRWLVIPAVFTALYGLLGYLMPSNRCYGIVLLLIAVAFTMTVLFFDYYSLLVGYERWCERGMPERWIQK